MHFKRVLKLLWIVLAASITGFPVHAAETKLLPVVGLKLEGPLAGKQAYVLGEDINLPYCWLDSVQWTGRELYFGLSSINFGKLIGEQVYEPDNRCMLPATQGEAEFDMYLARPAKDGWVVSPLPINSDISDAGIGVYGTRLTYTQYRLSPQDYDIYLSSQGPDGKWLPPQAFSQNSKCLESNPAFFLKGAGIIFESNRADAAGASCYDRDDIARLWLSYRKPDGDWSAPRLLSGPPALGKKNTQPWYDETDSYLYWTADSDGGVIRRIKFDGRVTQGAAETIMTPAMAELWQPEGDPAGKPVFVGEYSEAGGYSFFACAFAEPGGSFMQKWDVRVRICMIPP